MKMEFRWVKFWRLIGFKRIRSFTLIELMISIMITGMLIVCFYAFESFSNTQVIDSDRRAKVQNNLAYCLEHMSKYVQQATGDINNPPIVLWPNLINLQGFELKFDCLKTPSNLDDDIRVRYRLNNANELIVSLPDGSVGCILPVPVDGEILSDRIVAGCDNSIMPANPSEGFYVNLDPQGNLLNIGLVGRYDPTIPVMGAGKINPQVEMKTKVLCNSVSTN